MSSNQGPWPLPTAPWAPKSYEVYDGLRSGKRTSIEAVLHLTSKQYDTVAIFAWHWLQSNVTEHLRLGDFERRVAQQMKTHPKWGQLFSWVQNAGEAQGHVNDAIRWIFRHQKGALKRSKVKSKMSKQITTATQEETELPVEQPIARQPSIPLKRQLSFDDPPAYLSSIMIIDQDDTYLRRRVGVDQNTTFQYIQERAIESWQRWHKSLSRDMELDYAMPSSRHYGIAIWDEEDWQQALQSARQNKKMLEVYVFVPSERSGEA